MTFFMQAQGDAAAVKAQMEDDRQELVQMEEARGKAVQVSKELAEVCTHLTESDHKVVMQKPNPARICLLIFHINDNKQLREKNI